MRHLTPQKLHKTSLTNIGDVINSINFCIARHVAYKRVRCSVTYYCLCKTRSSADADEPARRV